MPGNRIIVCADCGQERKHEAHDLCRTCYKRWRRKQGMGRIVICADCGRERIHEARGFCKSCYHRWLKEVNPGFAERQQTAVRKWQAEHFKERVAYNRSWQLRNHELVKIYGRNWLKRNPEKRRASVRKYYETHREQARLSCLRRRAKVANLPNTLTSRGMEQLLAIGQGTYPGEKLHLDHFIPVSSSGGLTRANTHFIPAGLNMSKQDKLPQEIYAQLSLEDCYA